MDYTQQSIFFKVKKALRYVRLYGPKRTLVKINGQYHMKKKYDTLPILPEPLPTGGHVGILGCGNFAFSNIAYYLSTNYGCVIRAAMDIDLHKAASLYEKYSVKYYTDDASKIINDKDIDLIYIASNHASHAEYAITALENDKHVHIEKPHVVSSDQLVRLCRAMTKSKGKVALGFNRPRSDLYQKMKQSLDGQTGPLMMNWFVAGHEIAPEHWYFKDEEGGRILGNLCHWTDFIYQLVPPECRYPITITPTRAEKSDCDIAVSYIFGDGSIAIITFSAKGHTFEGVREKFSAHRGNVLISMDDFKKLVIENIDKKTVYSPLFRDHGHEINITNSYEVAAGKSPQVDMKYVWETGELFLKTREALEQNSKMTINEFNDSFLN